MTVERERPVLAGEPVLLAAPEPYDDRGTIDGMQPGATRIEIPRWIQLVGLPLALVLAWVIAGAVRHAIFLFLVAALIALLLNPLVRALGKVWVPRGIAVALVYLAFAAAVGLAILALATVVVKQTRTATHRVDAYFTVASGRSQQTGAQQDLVRFQNWLDHHHLQRIQVEKKGNEFLSNVGARDIETYTTKVLNWAEGAGLAAIQLLFSGVLVVVVSIYMLLDMPRLGRSLERRFPAHDGSQPLLERMEHALASYVRGQFLVSVIIGASSGFGLWLFGLTGVVPGIDNYALLFGAWVAVAELIPYVGPWLGAVPPVVYALVQHPLSALWVALLFLGVQQIEGHIVVPKLMGNALRLHPLLVIFGLLAGGEVYGLPGVLVALPLLAAARAAWEFFAERLELERWSEKEGSGTPAPVPVPVDLDVEVPERPAAPASP